MALPATGQVSCVSVMTAHAQSCDIRSGPPTARAAQAHSLSGFMHNWCASATADEPAAPALALQGRGCCLAPATPNPDTSKTSINTRAMRTLQLSVVCCEPVVES